MRTKSKIWVNSTPRVVFMVPSEHHEAYALFMKMLTREVEKDLGWEPDTIELIGLIAATAQHGTEGILFLEELGVNTRRLTLLILWADTAASVKFEKLVSPECGVGTVILPETGVVLPTLRMPSLDGDWWSDPLHQEYATVMYEELVQNGRTKAAAFTVEPQVFIATPQTWN